jgi:hypothetical protein
MHFKKNSEHNSYLLKDRIATAIAGFLVSLQSCFAQAIGAKTNALSLKAKWLWLFFFCLLFGGFSIYVFVGAFRDRRNAVKPSQISVPKYYDRTETRIEPLVSDRDIKRIYSFKKYMDSLRGPQEGKIVYDSILKARPGLMDSIQAVEQLYYSQSK